MIPPFWDRMRERMCRWFGHREDRDEYAVWCKRCRVLLRSNRAPSPSDAAPSTTEPGDER